MVVPWAPPPGGDSSFIVSTVLHKELPYHIEAKTASLILGRRICRTYSYFLFVAKPLRRGLSGLCAGRNGIG